jgi:hypothetical protein
MVQHEDIDHSGVAGLPGSFSGKPIRLFPQGHELTITQSTNATADVARAVPLIVPGECEIRSLWIHVTVSAAGSIEWGLFDLGSTLTAATKVAGGSAAPGGTGWREIAATAGPVTVPPGSYILIVENPISTPSTITTWSFSVAPGFVQSKSTYTWDDTPDLSTGWTDNSAMYLCFLEGDMDGSGTRW